MRSGENRWASMSMRLLPARSESHVVTRAPMITITAPERAKLLQSPVRVDA
jgi:hypothetical protein